MARRFAARIGVVREAAGIVAYRAGHFSEALSDLRAARRLTGSEAYLPVMADCERGLGRPERAIDLVRSPEAERLDRAGRIELTIVESGARRDLGQHDAAVITLQRLPELRDPQPKPWSARLAFAYADALADAGHTDAATDWFGRAMAFDEDGETDAADRYAELTGAVIEDVEEEFDDEDDFDDAGVAESEEAVEAEEDVDDSEVLAEADDLLGDEREPADLPGDEPERAELRGDEPEEAEALGDEPERAELRGDEPEEAEALGDEPEEAELRGDEPEEAEARGREPEAEAEPADVLDGTESDEQSSDDSGSEPSSSGSAAKAEIRGITPAFIEPNFGDTLDEEDEPTQNRPKSDD
ncbi:hypothetical protein EDD27_4923 [Nonomuraea polychroma]|uniref:Tetratricopeptide repeat protein n=1 Tax=Nonomuraea polychroma TaxID=46176 RepID=A0A438M998_9ACTN|nr:hypothetical protein EDD27_4923 [Nonomuraea polychroma]